MIKGRQRMGEIGKVDPQAKMDALEPYVKMLETKVFQTWMGTLKGELKILEEWAWRGNFNDPYGRFDAALNELNIPQPTNQTELMNVWMVLRGVSNYWGNKLAALELMKKQYEKLQAQVREALKKETEKMEGKKEGGK
jgi:hypothetical protein